MNIINIDYEKGIVQSDFYEWQIVCNDSNKFMLLQRESNGRFHAAEADVKKKHHLGSQRNHLPRARGGNYTSLMKIRESSKIVTSHVAFSKLQAIKTVSTISGEPNLF